MRGRKPQANAIRRGGSGQDGALEVTAEPITAEIEKPADIAATPALSETWDMVVGHGVGYQGADMPFLVQLVYNVEAANEAWGKCRMPDGSLRLTLPVGEPDECGVYHDYKPNPYIKIANDSTAMAMRLADQLGCTRTARARLGLTQSIAAAAQLSIAQQIDAAIGGSR